MIEQGPSLHKQANPNNPLAISSAMSNPAANNQNDLLEFDGDGGGNSN